MTAPVALYVVVDGTLKDCDDELSELLRVITLAGWVVPLGPVPAGPPQPLKLRIALTSTMTRHVKLTGALLDLIVMPGRPSDRLGLRSVDSVLKAVERNFVSWSSCCARRYRASVRSMLVIVRSGGN